MKRSRLKNKAKRTKAPADIVNYKKQRNLVVSLNRQAKYKSFYEVSKAKAQDLSGKLAGRTFQINMLAEILRLCSLKMIKCY